MRSSPILLINMRKMIIMATLDREASVAATTRVMYLYWEEGRERFACTNDATKIWRKAALFSTKQLRGALDLPMCELHGQKTECVACVYVCMADGWSKNKKWWQKIKRRRGTKRGRITTQRPRMIYHSTAKIQEWALTERTLEGNKGEKEELIHIHHGWGRMERRLHQWKLRAENSIIRYVMFLSVVFFFSFTFIAFFFSLSANGAQTQTSGIRWNVTKSI